MISAESLEELLGIINTLKFRNLEEWPVYEPDESKISDIWHLYGTPNKSGMDPYSGLQTGVGSNVIFCSGCLCWCTRDTLV